jgi:asparagine synthase (glutamine-hydrolysing)
MDPAQPDPLSNIRVMFVGEGPDNALLYMDWKPYLRWLLKKGRFIELSSAVRSRLRARPWAEIFSSLRAALRSNEAVPVPGERPAWLRHDALERRTSCGDLQSHQSNISDTRHPWHPNAVAAFRSPIWQDYFESFDAGIGWRLIEAVHPYLDVRMVQFLLSVPVVPWCHRKFLVRESMRGLLPELVLARKKTTLSEDPWVKAMVRHPFPPISKTSELSRYVDMSRIPNCWAADVEENRLIRRFLALQHWLAARDGRSGTPNRAAKDASNSAISKARSHSVVAPLP